MAEYTMNMSPNGLAVLKYFEHCVLTAYPDPASALGRMLQRDGLWQKTLLGAPIPIAYSRFDGSPWTIGWGDTGPDIHEGMRITQEDADDRLAARLAREFEPGVARALRVQVDQGQFDALTDFAFNLGVSALTTSTLMRCVNAGDRDAAGAEFPKWVNAGGKPMLGLKRRRAADRALFTGSTGAEAIAIGAQVSA